MIYKYVTKKQSWLSGSFSISSSESKHCVHSFTTLPVTHTHGLCLGIFPPSVFTLNITILQARLNSLCCTVPQLLKFRIVSRLGPMAFWRLTTGMWLQFQLNNPWGCYATCHLATCTHSIQWHGNMKGGMYILQVSIFRKNEPLH